MQDQAKVFKDEMKKKDELIQQLVRYVFKMDSDQILNILSYYMYVEQGWGQLHTKVINYFSITC